MYITQNNFKNKVDKSHNEMFGVSVSEVMTALRVDLFLEEERFELWFNSQTANKLSTSQGPCGSVLTGEHTEIHNDLKPIPEFR